MDVNIGSKNELEEVTIYPGETPENLSEALQIEHGKLLIFLDLDEISKLKLTKLIREEMKEEVV